MAFAPPARSSSAFSSKRGGRSGWGLSGLVCHANRIALPTDAANPPLTLTAQIEKSNYISLQNLKTNWNPSFGTVGLHTNGFKFA